MIPSASVIAPEVYVNRPKHPAPQCSSCGQLAISPMISQCGEFICFQCMPYRTECTCEAYSCAICPLTDFEKNHFRQFFCSCPFSSNGCEEVIPITDLEVHTKLCTHSGGDPQPSLLVSDVCIHSPEEGEPLCSNCDNLAISPKQTHCGELLCLQCHSSHSSCPCCGEPSCSTAPITEALNEQIRQFFCTCPFSHRGCQEIMPLTSVATHLLFCPHATILCPDCSTPITNADLPFHLHGSCQKRMIKCPRCLEEMPVVGYFCHDEDQHPVCDGCETRYHIPTEGKQHQLVQCTMCSRKLLVCQMGKHMAGHVEKKLRELKVERKRLQEAEDEVDELVIIKEDELLKEMRYTHHQLLLLSTFSPLHRGRFIELLDVGRTARLMSAGDEDIDQTVLIDHPGLTEGVHRWEMEVVEDNGDVAFGASPIPSGHDLGYPKSGSMFGSIGMNAGGSVYVSSKWLDSRNCFSFTTGDTIILRLDFTSRTITWTLKSDHSKPVTRPLPQPGPYVPVVGFWGTSGSAVRVVSTRSRSSSFSGSIS